MYIVTGPPGCDLEFVADALLRIDPQRYPESNIQLSADVSAVNSAIFDSAGGSWDRPPSDQRLVAATDLVSEQLKSVGSISTDALVLDSLMSFTIGAWAQKAFIKHVFLCVSNPELAASKLKKAHGIEEAYSIQLWNNYIRSYLLRMGGIKTTIVHTDVARQSSIGRLEELLAIRIPGKTTSELNAQLCSNVAELSGRTPSSIVELYRRIFYKGHSVQPLDDVDLEKLVVGFPSRHRISGCSENAKTGLIFTYNFDGYDSVNDPRIKSDGWDHICYTNAPLKTNIWQAAPIPDYLSDVASPKRLASRLKIDHFRHIQRQYSVCISVDASMFINEDLNDFLAENWSDRLDLMIAKHPRRNCLYQEAEAILDANMDDEDVISSQVNRYRKEGFPENFGLYGTRMMVKNNNSAALKRVSEIWDEEYQKGSLRDQMSLTYAIWKAEKEGVFLKIKDFDFKEIYYASGRFQINGHLKPRGR